MVTPDGERLRSMFAHLATGDPQRFVEGCAPGMTLTARGVAESTVTVRRSGIAEWFGSFDSLTGGTLRSEVETAVADDGRAVVVLRHTFVLDGTPRAYRTVNFCTLRGDRLLAWFCHPASRAEYASAWGLAVPADVTGGVTVAALR